MKYSFVFLFLTALFLFTACDDDPTEEKAILNYFPLAVGNYWIYDLYVIEADGTERIYKSGIKREITREDIVSSLVGDFTYYILNEEGSPSNTFYFRKSGNDIYAPNMFYLSYANFIDTLYAGTVSASPNYESEMYDISYKMELGTEIETPAGIFKETINRKATYYVYPRYQTEDLPDTRYLNEYYANNVGMILKEYTYISFPHVTYQYRLVDYYIKEN